MAVGGTGQPGRFQVSLPVLDSHSMLPLVSVGGATGGEICRGDSSPRYHGFASPTNIHNLSASTFSVWLA